MFGKPRISIIILLIALGLMLAAIVMVASTPSVALASGDFEYRTISNGSAAEITGYTGNGTDVHIPSLIGSLPVTSIGASAFANNKTVPLSSVSIPDTVTSIGDYAFYQCPATITIPSAAVTIGNHSFDGCTGLNAVAISGKVISIGDSAFLGTSATVTINAKAPVAGAGNSTFGLGGLEPSARPTSRSR